jgi:hypothetical protein
VGYTFDCDGCGDSHHNFPPFAGEFTEEFLKTVGGKFAAAFKPGQKVTICSECMELYVLAGKVFACLRCGFSDDLMDLPDGIDECPRCEESEFSVRERDTDD